MTGRWAGAIGAIAVALTLVGCGSSTTTTGGSSPSPSVAATSPSAATSPAAGASSSPAALAGTPRQRAALDRVIAASDAQVPRLLSMFANLYSNIEFTPRYPSTLLVTYTFVNPVDPATAKPRILAEEPVLQAACKANFFRAMAMAGITHPGAEYIYDNPDGSTVVTYTCQS